MDAAPSSNDVVETARRSVVAGVVDAFFRLALVGVVLSLLIAPDVVGLVEPNERWLRALAPALADYPHRLEQPREDNFGMALYSRRPLRNARFARLAAVPTIVATIDLGSREVDLVLVHVLPPISSDYVAMRDAHLEKLGQLRPCPGHGLVLAGDFNLTPYSPRYAQYFEAQGFRLPRAPIGTFPAGLPAVLRIPIDHALFTGDVHVRSAPEHNIGSDHLPLSVRITPAPEAAP